MYLPVYASICGNTGRDKNECAYDHMSICFMYLYVFLVRDKQMHKTGCENKFLSWDNEDYLSIHLWPQPANAVSQGPHKHNNKYRSCGYLYTLYICLVHAHSEAGNGRI